MGTHQRGELPKDLAQGRSRFEAWRERRSAGRRIPQPLWDLAVHLVSKHGISRTATALGLDYYSLKKRSETAGSERPSRTPAFVELPASVAMGKQCLFEVNHQTGVSVRVQLTGYDTADLEALVRHFGNAD